MTGGPPTPTLLFLHAHPDDEAILTGATLAKARAKGLRTIVVYGTSGDAGETTLDLGGETLGERRAVEAALACADLGVSRIEWLGYADSGMAGTATNANPAAFSNAPVDAVTDQVVAALAGEAITAIVGYDPNGTYGHPDHVHVHRVAHALAARWPTTGLWEATFNREQWAALPEADRTLDAGFGTSELDLTHFVQGEAWFRAKMAAVKRHDSQAPRNRRSGTSRPIDAWRARFGTEWFVRVREPEQGSRAALFEPKGEWPGPLGAAPAA